jgi:hypothetical protein
MTHSSLTKGIRDRIHAILTAGYGVGTYTHAITSGIFNVIPRLKSIDDPGLVPAVSDRYVEWRWVSRGRQRVPSVPTAGRGTVLLEADLFVSYLYGEGAQGFLRSCAVTGEDAAEAALNVTDRAATDSECIQLALETQGILAGIDGESLVYAVGIVQTQPTQILQVTPTYHAPARLLTQTRFEVTLSRDNTQVIR